MHTHRVNHLSLPDLPFLSLVRHHYSSSSQDVVYMYQFINPCGPQFEDKSAGCDAAPGSVKDQVFIMSL